MIGDIRKTAVAVVSVKCLVVVRKGRDEQIDLAVAVVIAYADPHRRLRASVLAQRESRCVTHIFKRAVVPVTVEIVCRRIVGHG